MRLAIVTLSVLLAGLPAQAAERAWHGGGDDLNAELRYGTSDKSDTPIQFYCTPHVDIVYVEYRFRPANATEAMEADFSLAAGGITIPVGAIGYNIGDTSFVLEGQIIFDQKFRDMIGSDGALTATAEGKTETFPLEEAREKAGALLGMCGREG